MAFLILVIAICVVGYGIVAGIKRRKQQEAEYRTFAGEHQGWDIYVSPHDRGVLALDHDDRRIAVGKVADFVEHPWSDISTVEIEKNGQSIVQTNRGAAVMGAAVGAVLLGPVGLLVGGLSASKRQKQRINELSLKLMIDNRTAPIHRVVFFRMAGNGADAKDKTLNGPAGQLEHFHALIANAIRSDERAYYKPADATNSVSDNSEDRISRLWDLHQAGALTAEEYATQKSTILLSQSGNRFRKSLT